MLGMSRQIRFIPEGGALVEVTHRALHSRLLFRPSPMLNQIIIGTLARAKRRYKVRVCFFVAASNHLHLYLDVDDAKQLGPCMAFLRPGHSEPDSTREVLSGATRDSGRPLAEGPHGSGT